MKSILFAAAASAALAAAMPAFANDAAGSEVDELIVTARAGAEQRKVEASYAITTMSEERLRMQSPVSTAEALKNVPGFWVEASGGEATPPWCTPQRPRTSGRC